MAGIELNGVGKDYGAVRAVDSLDLVVENGEFVSILGPSGCGKTTLLRMLAGLEQPTRGQIHINDQHVNELPPSKRDIAMVFQTYALYPHMTVAGNIEYPLKKRRVSAAERTAKVSEVAELLQLGELLSRKPKELSGGQQQRVALGRALVRDPAIFLLDEPLSNLDARLRSHMRTELIQLHRRIGRTMVYVTHDQLEAMTMSDRIAVLKDGQLQQFASPTEVYARPANDFVAGFIGTPSMNFIDGHITVGGDHLSFSAGDWTLPMPGLDLDESAEFSDGRLAVRLGLRPEDLLVDTAGEEARVVVVEPTGHEIIVIVSFFGNEIIIRVTPDHLPRVNDQLLLKPRIDHVHIFAADGGQRLNADKVQRGSNESR